MSHCQSVLTAAASVVLAATAALCCYLVDRFWILLNSLTALALTADSVLSSSRCMYVVAGQWRRRSGAWRVCGSAAAVGCDWMGYLHCDS